METKEKRFEQDIETFLLSEEGGYTSLKSSQFDIDKCICMDVLCEFIEKTQPKEWEKYLKYYGENASEKLYHRLERCISEQGLIFVLRHGIEDLGIKLKLCYFKPESTLNEHDAERYKANILGCTRQFRYSPDNTNTIDMVLSINGIPVAALELKNQLTGQDYHCAIKQYKTDRSSKEYCFRLDHRFLVYFAVDLYEAWMTTQLKNGDTEFIPFNQGSNGPGVNGGAGNPQNPNGYSTSYLWEEVLQRDSFINILHRFVSHIKKKDEKTGKIKEFLLFPRYHQYDVVESVLEDVKEKGAGQNYLIQHSAGSGKSNSIAWIAYRLASVHDKNDEKIFSSVIVVTNRVVLDSQLQDTINSFEHTYGLVEAINEKKNSRSLAEAINAGKSIIISTVQKFMFGYKDMERYKGRRFAIIIDEAHQGQNGESARMLRSSLLDHEFALEEYKLDSQKDAEVIDIDLEDEFIRNVIGQGRHANQSFFAFTATPKGTTLEVFGTEYAEADGTIRKVPYHVYSMKQAIEEGFILDVLQNYTTIREAFKIVRVSEDNPELIEGSASKALFKYYKKHGYTIAQKTEMIMSNFLSNGRFQICGKGKAMIVADSRANAVRYYFAIKDYLKNHPEESTGCDVMVAFSGEVKLDERPMEKPFTEATMNLDEKGRYITSDKKFREVFHSEKYNILVVAEKYQTGFDEPLLHSMYVDKRLKSVTAVQTLSRLNRACPNKTSTFVLDFENTEEDIKKAFLPFYETSTMEGSTDPNIVYDYRNRLHEYMLFNYKDVEEFNSFMAKQSGKNQTATALGKIAGMFRPVIDRYRELSENDQYAVRDYLRKFTRTYAYITQIIRLHDRELFEEYLYSLHFLKVLPASSKEIIDIDDKVKLEYANLKETHTGAIILDEKQVVYIPGQITAPKKPNKKRDTLQSIIDKVNERYDGQFTDGDRVIIEGIYRLFMDDKDVKKFKKYASDNSTEMFVNSLFPDKFKEIVTQCFMGNNESFKKLFNDPEFYKKVQDVMAKEIYKSLRKDDEK